MQTGSFRRLFRPSRVWLLAVLVIAIEAVYVFIITAGTFVNWPTWNANYNLTAEGFRSGHLYIPVAPPPELLAKANPMDWSNERLWFRDASLYKGHYYLYWGPLPALILLAVKVVFRITAEIGDQYSLFLYYSLFLVAGVLLIDRMSRRLFPRIPLPLVALSVVAFGFVVPTTFMLATPGIYEAAIGAGQAFLLLGLVFAFDAVWAASQEPPSRRLLLGAGLAFTAAVASRITTVLPVVAFVPLTAFFASSAGARSRRRFVTSALWLGTPVLVGFGALLAYNKARFGEWLEIGNKYQLNTYPFTVARRFFAYDVFSYLFRPLGESCRFPFLAALYDIGARGFPRWFHLPRGYSTHEPQSGLFVSSPWTLLAVVAIGFAVVRAVRWARAGGVPTELDRRASAEVWCVGSFLALVVLTSLPFISLLTTTMRYMADFSTGMALLSVWGAWTWLLAVRRPVPRGLVVTVLVALAGVTVVVGFLLGFKGYDEMFKWHNPALYQSLIRRLSFCR